MHDLAGRDVPLERIEEADELLMPVALAMLRPKTVPSSTSRAAKSVVVPLRL